MCDYSLHHFSNRLAVEGEQLLVHRFPTGTLGLASPFDLWTPEEPSDQTTAGWWSRVKNWLILSGHRWNEQCDKSSGMGLRSPH